MLVTRYLKNSRESCRRDVGFVRGARALLREQRARHNSAVVANRKEEAGAILVLAMIFLVAVSLIVTGLLTWTGSSLSSTTAFGSERSTEYAATSAVDLAIQDSRYAYDSSYINASPPVPCFGSSAAPPAFQEGVNDTSTQVTIDVYCSMLVNPTSSETRIITYSACSLSSNLTVAQCAATPLLQVVVSFDDYSGITSPPPDCDANTSSSCGLTMAQLSWTWRPVTPTVSSISPSNGPIAGGTSLIIDGTGFVQGSTVNFVEESLGTPTTSPSGVISGVATSSSDSCTWPTCLTVTTPSVTQGTTYFVTVTTPGAGTSPYVNPNPSNPYTAVFTYQTAASAPTLTYISGSVPSGQSYVGGSITGGTVVTITGTNFYSGGNNGQTPPTVNFICVTSSGCSAGTYQANPDLVTVDSDTQMTVVSPDLSSPSPGTYYLQVITTAGSAGSSSNTNDLYDYTTQVPLVTGLSSVSAPVSTLLTVSGGNFLNTSSVTFVEESNGTPSPNFNVNNCTTTNGSANVTTTGSFSNVFPGMPVSGNGIPSGTTVLTVKSATSITLSANATAGGTTTLSFTPSIPGTNVSVSSATSLQVTTPAAVPSATTYFVVVSWTLSGTTYSSQEYQVTSANPDGDVFTFTDT